MKPAILSTTRLGLFALILTGAVACGGPKTAAVPAPPAPPANLPNALFEDEFDTYNPQWRTVRGQWAVNGGNVLQARDDEREQNTIFYYDPLPIADGQVTTAVTIRANLPQFQTAQDAELLNVRRRIAGAGLVFRYQNENNFYMFRIAGEEGAVLGKMVDGQWQDLANPRATEFSGALLRTDQQYTLRVRTVGRNIQCFINNRAVASLDDSSFSTGRFGLVTFRTQALFAYVNVERP